MANKKITELNEASSITSADWLVMVDTGNDETKKIHPDLVGASVPIQDTAPASPEENDLWIDTSEPEEMQEAIVNEYSESTSETYSCDYVNKLDKYSTTEVKTGKVWIDGKPIYRVCKNVGYLPNNGRIIPSFADLIPLNATITHLDGICHRFASDIHDYRPISDMVITFLYRTTTGPDLFIDTNTDYSAWECIAIIEYTKP